MTALPQMKNSIVRRWTLVILGLSAGAFLGLPGANIASVEAAQHKIIVMKKHHTSRSGVMMKAGSSYKSYSARKKLHSKRSGVTTVNRNAASVSSSVNRIGYLQRRKEIARRNEAVRRDNLERRAERRFKKYGDVPTVIVFDENDDRIVTVGQGRPIRECPQNHNCGTRLYSDGSGPRIIQLGDGTGNENGYSNGPRIIRLN